MKIHFVRTYENRLLCGVPIADRPVTTSRKSITCLACLRALKVFNPPLDRSTVNRVKHSHGVNSNVYKTACGKKAAPWGIKNVDCIDCLKVLNKFIVKKLGSL